jgi:hypothetical protein
MASGTEHLAPGLHDYLAGHSTPPDALLRDLISETAGRFPDRTRLQIGQEQGDPRGRKLTSWSSGPGPGPCRPQ